MTIPTNDDDKLSSSYFSSYFDPKNDDIRPLPDPEDRNYSDDNEELFPSSSNDRANLFGSSNNEAKVRLGDRMRDGAEKNNIDGTHKQSCRKREGDLDGDLYHCMWDSNLNDDMQNNAETLSNHPQHPYHLQRKVQTLLPPNQLDVIDNDSHLGCSFVHPSSLVRIFEDSQSAQSVFAIQVRIIGPPSVGCSFVHPSFLDRIFGDS